MGILFAYTALTCGIFIVKQVAFQETSLRSIDKGADLRALPKLL